jgi:hypothetical protein
MANRFSIAISKLFVIASRLCYTVTTMTYDFWPNAGAALRPDTGGTAHMVIRALTLW